MKILILSLLSIFIISCKSEVDFQIANSATILDKASEETNFFRSTIVKAQPETIDLCSFSSQPDDSSILPLQFKITFDREIDVTTFEISDVIQLGNAIVKSWSLTDCGDGLNFMLEVTEISAYGSVAPSIKSNSVESLDSAALGGVTSPGTEEESQVSFSAVSDFIWVGDGADNEWTNSLNWKDGNIPTSDDIAVFSGNFCTSCNVDITSDITLSGLVFDESYTSTLQISNNATVRINGDLVHRNGNLKLGNGTLRLNGNGNLLQDKFFAENSTFEFFGTLNTLSADQVHFYNFSILHDKYLQHSFLYLEGDIYVEGLLYVSKSSNTKNTYLEGDIINVLGDLDVNNSEYQHTSALSPIFNFSGTGDQYITSNGHQLIPVIAIDKPSGTLYFDTDSFGLPRDFNYIQGNVSFKTDSLFVFAGGSSSEISPGPIEFENVRFSFGGSAHSPTKTLHSELIVRKKLTIATSTYMDKPEIIAGANILVDGDVEISNYDTNTYLYVIVELVGSTDQNVSILDDTFPGHVIVNKPFGNVIQQSAMSFNKTGQNLTLISGNWNMNSYDLNIANELTLESGSSMLQACGNLTYGSLVSNGGYIDATCP